MGRCLGASIAAIIGVIIGSVIGYAVGGKSAVPDMFLGALIGGVALGLFALLPAGLGLTEGREVREPSLRNDSLTRAQSPRSARAAHVADQ